MKKTGVYLLATALFLSACIPALPTLQQPEATPANDVQATDAALALTLAVETLNALPTPTLVPATDTLEPTATFTETATAVETATITATLTPDPNASATATETALPPTATVTGTLPSVTPSVATATETLHPRFYGTLPPALPSGKVYLVNKAKAEVYVSLHCTTIDGYTTFIEYPVEGRMKVAAPLGKYSYVAWVGGREFKGSFSLSKNNDVVITFNKDKVTVNK
jgi:hypothetical protein